MRGMVFNIQKYSIHDGPGTRTLIFLKGCPLRCRWCSNPESQSVRPEALFEPERCVSCGLCAEACPQGLHRITAEGHVVERGACLGCGRCADACLNGALQITGREMTVEEVLETVMQDAAFYWASGGGVTLSGGEATGQPNFCRALLAACRDNGVHTALETCGHAAPEVMEALAPHVDLFLYDIKQMDDDKHKRLTGVGKRLIQANLRRLWDMGKETLIRMPLIPSLNDGAAEVQAALRMVREAARGGARVRGVELLPYHRYGERKYAQLGQGYALADLEGYTEEELKGWRRFAAAESAADMPVRVVISG